MLMTSYEPAFDPRIRRQFPFLAAEDTNPLFQAFRERRLREKSHPRRFTRRLAAWLQAATVLLLLAIIAVPFVLYLGSARIPLLFPVLYVFFFLPMGAYLRYVAQRRRVQGASLPMRVRDVYLGGTWERAATDLYLAGATGRVVAEAMLLEDYEGLPRAAARGSAALCAVTIGVMAWMAFRLGSIGVPPLLTMTAVMILFHALSATVVRSQVAGSLRMLENLTQSWNEQWSVLPSSSELQSGLRMAILAGTYLLLAAVVGIALVALLSPHQDGSAFFLHWQHWWGWYSATYAILAIAGLLWLFPQLEPVSAERLEQVLDRADQAFEQFMLDVVLSGSGRGA